MDLYLQLQYISFMLIFKGWTRWGPWSACRGRCGSGIRIRTRTCSRPYDYRYCQGPSSQTKYCHHNAPCE